MKKTILALTLTLLSCTQFATAQAAVQFERNENTPLKVAVPITLNFKTKTCIAHESKDVSPMFHPNSRYIISCSEWDYYNEDRTVNAVIKFKQNAMNYSGPETYILTGRTELNRSRPYLTLTPVNDLAKTRSIHQNAFGAFIVE